MEAWVSDEGQLDAVDDESVAAASLLTPEASLRPLSRVGQRRLLAERKKLTELGAGSGMRVRATSRPQIWRLDCFNFSPDSLLASDLAHRRLHLVTLEVLFEPSFPVRAPRLRVLSPRLAYPSPHILAGGVVLLEEGFWKAQPMQQLFQHVHALLAACRLDLAATQPCYRPEEAAASLFPLSDECGRHATDPRLNPAEYVLYSCHHAGLSARPGNRIDIPASILNTLTGRGEALPKPMLLELFCKRTQLRTHVGVHEFSAAPETLVAPRAVLQNLGCVEGESVAMRLVTLPKCSFLRLEPFSRSFMAANRGDRTKVLAACEWQLPNFAAFTVGDVLQLEHDGESTPFFVLDARPEAAVTCIAEPYLDIEIDFVAPVDFRESADDLSNSMGASGEHAMANSVGANVLGEAADGVACPHCQRRVPESSFAMHEMACQRRNQVCDKCGVVVTKGAAWDEHLAHAHATVSCPACAEKLEQWTLSQHRATQCPERRISCPHGCNYYASAKNVLGDHAETCGARSYRCPTCLRMLRVRDKSSHQCAAPQVDAYFCPLCVGEEQEPLLGEIEFVSHLDRQHAKTAKSTLEIACPVCIAEGSIGVGETTPLLSHLELHRYRLKMRQKMADR